MADLIEILKKGMSTELWGRRFYEEAVARTESEDGKRVFQSLVEEETRHLEILCGQYAAYSEGGSCVSTEQAIEMAQSVDPTQIFPEASAAAQLIAADATDEQALKMAMDFEQRGYDLYAEAAKDAAGDEERKLWEFLAKAEDKHYAFLQETYDYLINNGVWYFDDQEFPFFEG
jgi:rubrerythrin